jgi:hypothetical protein
MQKARSQPHAAPKDAASLLPLVGMWFQALFHSPPRGAFHLSLTVLVHYRSHGSLSPWRVVPPASRPITRVGRYSGTPLRSVPPLHLPGCHRLWRPVPGDFGCVHPSASVGPTTPPPRRAPVWAKGPVRSPLLGASRLIPLPPGTEMFQFPGFASPARGDTGARAPVGFPIRPPGDHGSCAAPPRFSQLTAAFLASVCPGIPHMPSLA